MSFSLENFLPYRLSRLAEAVSNEIRPVYKGRAGLNRPDWRVLAALRELGAATATAVGSHSAQHKTKVSRAVMALEKRRWVKRKPAADDRRSEILELTHAGRDAHDDLVAPLLLQEAGILEKLTDAERAALDTALRALERALLEENRPTSEPR